MEWQQEEKQEKQELSNVGYGAQLLEKLVALARQGARKRVAEEGWIKGRR